MSQSRLELKVGLFVVVCLVIFGGLILQFSKGLTLFRETYTIDLQAANVGGLRARASVLMSGVQVGTVVRTELSAAGTNVSIYLKIYSKYKIHRDALFKIEQSGFLGDQYVAIYPGKNELPLFVTGDLAHAEEPFNLQEVARAASGFIQRLDQTARKLDDAIADVRRLALNEKTLTNLSATVANLHKVSDDALVTVGDLNQLIKSNTQPVGVAVSNLVAFSGQLNGVALRAQGLLDTNSPQINMTISNLQSSAASLKSILASVDAGEGLAGALIKNKKVGVDFAAITGNLATTTSNLNAMGLWHFLFFKPKPLDQTQWPTDTTTSSGPTQR